MECRLGFEVIFASHLHVHTRRSLHVVQLLAVLPSIELQGGNATVRLGGIVR